MQRGGDVTDPTAPPPPPPTGPGGYGGYGTGPGGSGPPPPPPYGGPQEPDKSGNVFGLISLIAGIISIVLCWCFWAGAWAGIPAIVLGAIGLRKSSEGKATNRTMALVGLILGVVGVLLLVVSAALYFSGAFKGFRVGDYRVR
jgi:Domain of unknown function (DUF4190)